MLEFVCVYGFYLPKNGICYFQASLFDTFQYGVKKSR